MSTKTPGIYDSGLRTRHTGPPRSHHTPHTRPPRGPRGPLFDVLRVEESWSRGRGGWTPRVLGRRPTGSTCRRRVYVWRGIPLVVPPTWEGVSCYGLQGGFRRVRVSVRRIGSSGPLKVGDGPRCVRKYVSDHTSGTTEPTR